MPRSYPRKFVDEVHETAIRQCIEIRFLIAVFNAGRGEAGLRV